MEKIKMIWRKWNLFNEKCQRNCETSARFGYQKEYDYWSKMLRVSGKMLCRLEFMYGLTVYYSAFGRRSHV